MSPVQSQARNNYVSQYVPLPYEMISGAIAKKDQAEAQARQASVLSADNELMSYDLGKVPNHCAVYLLM